MENSTFHVLIGDPAAMGRPRVGLFGGGRKSERKVRPNVHVVPIPPPILPVETDE